MTNARTPARRQTPGHVSVRVRARIDELDNGSRARRLVSSTVLLAALVTSASSLAADIEAGKTKAAICASCHGVAGLSSMDMWPNLAGQKTAYLAKQIKAFRDDVRKDPVMNSVATGLSDADIDNLAAFYNSLPAGGD